MQTSNTDNHDEDMTSFFESYKKQQLEPVKGYKFFSYTEKKNKKRNKPKKAKKSSTPEEPQIPSDDNVVEPLPMELLEELEKSETSSLPKQSKNKKRNKKKIVVTSSVVDDSYIPLETGCTTNFSLVRLDKGETLSSASTALQFYNDQLYGKRVARVSADTLMSSLKKSEARKALTKRLNRF